MSQSCRPLDHRQFFFEDAIGEVFARLVGKKSCKKFDFAEKVRFSSFFFASDKSCPIEFPEEFPPCHLTESHLVKCLLGESHLTESRLAKNNLGYK